MLKSRGKDPFWTESLLTRLGRQSTGGQDHGQLLAEQVPDAGCMATQQVMALNSPLANGLSLYLPSLMKFVMP